MRVLVGSGMDVIPAVDVLGGAVVRLVQGDFEQVTVYDDDPGGVVAAWGARGAVLVHVVDLDGARRGRPDRRLWEALGRVGIPVQLGGGLRDVATALAALEAGAARVVLGTAAVWQPEVVSETVRQAGRDRVVAALDVRGGRAQGAGWTDEGVPLEEVLAALGDSGVTRVLVTGIGRDGTMRGPELAPLARVRALQPRLGVIASGGVGGLDDLRMLRDAGAEAAVVGRALYEGRFTFEEALAAAGRGS